MTLQLGTRTRTRRSRFFLLFASLLLHISILFHILPNLTPLVQSKPIALVTPDPSNTKLIVHESGIEFLEKLKAPLAIVAVSGRAKTGKSFMLNQILNVEDGKRDGFPVGVHFTPGTKGLLLWDEPQTVRLPNCKHSDEKECTIQVLYMDTEGLGVAGSATDGYDPKICALSILLSSLFIYNVNHDILMSDVSLLHSVVALSSIFEASTSSSFPFPPIFWTVQQFEHELGLATPDDVLSRALSEITLTNSSAHSAEISRYNETVRTVKSRFPEFSGDTRILLMHRPHTAKMSQLPNVRKEEYRPEYTSQIQHLRDLIKDHVVPKQFSSGLPTEENTGKFIAQMVRSVVKKMNEIESTHFGIALVRQISEQLQKRAWRLYFTALNTRAPLPQSEEMLQRVHEEEKIKSLEMFKTKCPGGLTKFGNKDIYESLSETIQTWFDSQLGNNTLVARVHCNEQVNKIFEKAWSQENERYTVDSFDNDISSMTVKYNTNVRGPKYIKEKALTDMLQKLKVKRINLLHQEAKQDLTSMLVVCLTLFLGAYVVYYVVSVSGHGVLPSYVPKALILVKLASLALTLWLLALHLNFAHVPDESLVSFMSIQLCYRSIRRYFTIVIICTIIIGMSVSHILGFKFAAPAPPVVEHNNTELVEALTEFFKTQGMMKDESDQKSLGRRSSAAKVLDSKVETCDTATVTEDVDEHDSLKPLLELNRRLQSTKVISNIADSTNDVDMSELIPTGVTTRGRRMLPVVEEASDLDLSL